jgi:hypothetical protein
MHCILVNHVRRSNTLFCLLHMSFLGFIGLRKELTYDVGCHTWEGDEVLVVNGGK